MNTYYIDPFLLSCVGGLMRILACFFFHHFPHRYGDSREASEVGLALQERLSLEEECRLDEDFRCGSDGGSHQVIPSIF